MSFTGPQVNLEPRFLASCLEGPFFPNGVLFSPTSFDNLSLSDDIESTDDGDATKTPLTQNYPNAYSDFHGCGTPCIFKSGPEWPISEGPLIGWKGVVRERRPVYRHAIQPAWVSIGQRIYQELDSFDVMWTSINPLAYANAGERKPFCPLIICIGVKPNTLPYEKAVAAAAIVKKILAEAGFPDLEVAFVESVVTRSAGPKLLPFNPLLDDVPELRKPFTPALGLPIALGKYPYHEGTAALYIRLSKDDNRVAILTCAHVVRPPYLSAAQKKSKTKGLKHRDEVIALGTMGFNNGLTAMMKVIGGLYRSIEVWNRSIDGLGKFHQGESNSVTKKRNDFLDLVLKAIEKIQMVNTLHDEVTKQYSTFEQRKIGFVLHAEKIEVSEPHKFTNDWALIELYNDKIDWSSFKGNKVFVGGNLSIADFGNTMFPQAEDSKDYHYPEDGLLQAYGVVQDNEMRDPQHLDVHGEKCLLVVKHGMATGTTVGRVNGLESFTRIYTYPGINQTYMEIAVLNYGQPHGKFSSRGDSGSVVLDRIGRIVGIITGGAGPTGETDISYLTPYWSIEEQIKFKFPDSFLYDVVE